MSLCKAQHADKSTDALSRLGGLVAAARCTPLALALRRRCTGPDRRVGLGWLCMGGSAEAHWQLRTPLDAWRAGHGGSLLWGTFYGRLRACSESAGCLKSRVTIRVLDLVSGHRIAAEATHGPPTLGRLITAAAAKTVRNPHVLRPAAGLLGCMHCFKSWTACKQHCPACAPLRLASCCFASTPARLPPCVALIASPVSCGCNV